ncbi:MAG TPA: aldo/keto reductase [Halieaceae bacterium]|jgi:diketogulonate reductase-like aldo/keto reductase|uniref:aldo/keto reductase n=1 Tax=Haliea TaxID=475794 RepID=UPI000C474306|nr:aldo/keto reductase [Haliea sp.]HBQ38967.1 aldo/keto reductase [Halieaceae bacterium]MAD63986.1 aldo/keto reductase [Haliea sp.]MAY92391.1 aldo/keto reductase [Haliea sp.]MBK40981.1 aldo/keto reductase [Haliea sp.]MBP68444.1 aldo/keto reductase [Haliea sp.]|tara:strand:- start:5017 stop:5949 length:933 start_codon:yes stop_codon:yes gene_type:complete
MLSRRQLLSITATLAAVHALPPQAAAVGAKSEAIVRTIPSSGEPLPVIGMGTSRTFDVATGDAAAQPLMAVLKTFFAGGGTVIDSSPMYGKAEQRVGDLLRAMPARPPVFAATKVWTEGREAGIAQMQQSAQRMAVDRFDLIAVHNLTDWRTQLDTLKRWKEEGKVRYIGITTSHGRDHGEFLRVMREEPLDFVQFSYNIADRRAEEELLPTAAERGIATMINRPYQRGELFSASRGAALPQVATELGCSSWGQFFLKFILGHPAVTCVIPATSSPKHMRDNMQAGVGRVPDTTQRKEMLEAFAALQTKA